MIDDVFLQTIIQCIPSDITQWDRLSVSDQPNVSENSTDYRSKINSEVLSSKSNKSDYSSVDSRLCPPFSSIYNNLESDSSIRNKEINFSWKIVAQNEDSKENVINIVYVLERPCIKNMLLVCERLFKMFFSG
ncbi:hypothetical protein NPIL_9751 [Nephila pilipes]|uniref:Uncharacterized protein n=1 Tax=Nephila pilipes TaxID=299642 RepID=A0A8X6UAG8_NEPPI|nr:hypothetical protein NPIL_9751 [Nephila pilipes]